MCYNIVRCEYSLMAELQLPKLIAGSIPIIRSSAGLITARRFILYYHMKRKI